MALTGQPQQNQSPMTDDNGAAKYLNVETGTLAVWRCTGRYKLPFVKIGRSVKYRYEDLDAFIARNTIGGETLQ
jgi:excisionase family DNA binding protein